MLPTRGAASPSLSHATASATHILALTQPLTRARTVLNAGPCRFGKYNSQRPNNAVPNVGCCNSSMNLTRDVNVRTDRTFATHRAP